MEEVCDLGIVGAARINESGGRGRNPIQHVVVLLGRRKDWPVLVVALLSLHEFPSLGGFKLLNRFHRDVV